MTESVNPSVKVGQFGGSERGTVGEENFWLLVKFIVLLIVSSLAVNENKYFEPPAHDVAQ